MDDFDLIAMLNDAHEFPDVEPYVEEYEPPQVLAPHDTPNLGCIWSSPFRVTNDSYTVY